MSHRTWNKRVRPEHARGVYRNLLLVYVSYSDIFAYALLAGVRTTATSMVSSMVMMATESPTLWVRGSLQNCCWASFMQITVMLTCVEFCCR